jgi:hypothetical protein
MFTIDTESGFPDVVFITSSYGLGETVVQGAVNPDEFYVFKPTLQAGKYPIIRRSIGSKLIKMEFTKPGEAGRVKTVDVPPNCATAIRSPTTTWPSWRVRDDHREALRPSDGHRVGQGRQGRQDLHPAGPSGDREEPVGRQGRAALQAQGHGAGADQRSARSARRSARVRCA